jgi:predicted GTPase
MVEKVVIMGAAGRDFHNFNVYFKDNPRYRVLPSLPHRFRHRAALLSRSPCGELYPEASPSSPSPCWRDSSPSTKSNLVAFSYSDVPYVEVMHKASIRHGPRR